MQSHGVNHVADLALRQAAFCESWVPAPGLPIAEIGRVVGAFLDAASTSFGRATFYNAKGDQQAAEFTAHEAMLRCDRDLYTLLLMLPGVTDRARQIGIKNLLAHRPAQDSIVERQILHSLVAELPAQRTFKLFEGLAASAPGQGIARANNARTRKLILRTILQSSRLELWTVKYRRKMAAALTHAWGQRKTSILRAILARPEETWTPKERAILRKDLDRFVAGTRLRAYECVGFALGNTNRVNLPLVQAYEAAKVDLAAGRLLPSEVLEGIRSVYHKDAPKGDVVRLTAAHLTTTQKLLTQKRAQEAGVRVDFDPMAYDAVRLYLYAFEMGMTEAIAKALLLKAHRAASRFPLRFERIGVVVDASRSMRGDSTQSLRPMAVALSLRDLLQHVAPSIVIHCGGGATGPDEMLVRPQGDTSLAEGLVEALLDGAEAVFVLSDGYENRPAGRFAETIAALREMGVRTPVFHLNPVFAAESGATRALCPEGVLTLPVHAPDSFGLTFLRGMLQTDPVRAVRALVRLALPSNNRGAS